MLKPARKHKDPEGRMPLAEHLRELRNRLFKAMLAVIVVTIVAAFFYWDIIDFLTRPVEKSIGCHAALSQVVHGQAHDKKHCANLTMNGLLGPFTLAMKVTLMAGVVFASPVWLYQLWAFLAPGLHANEKKYALSFVGAGVPLFLLGGFFAYRIMPTTARVLIGFTPNDVSNLVPLDEYLDLVIRMVVVFGLSFELPLLLVLLNLVGIITGRRMVGWWRGMVLGITVFAAVATPSTDPLSMCALAGPIVLLYFMAVGFSLVNDARKERRRAEDPDAQLDDDEASDLDLSPEPVPSDDVDAGAIDGSDDLDPVDPVTAEPVSAGAVPEQPGSRDGGSASAGDRPDDDIT